MLNKRGFSLNKRSFFLNKRAQILFDDETYKTLREIARNRGSSVGELVRNAVKKTYKDKARLTKPKTLAEAAKGTFGAWKDYSGKYINPLSAPWSKPDKVFK